MNLFTRTDRGESNKHLFCNKDFIVYVEGESKNKGEKEYSENSDDIRYWKPLFEHYLPEHTFKFQAFGSKKAVKDYANKIQSGAIQNVIAVMDRDYDHLKKEIIDHNNVIYSYGYSWENDICNEESISEAIIDIVGACPTHGDKVYRYIKMCFDNFKKDSKNIVEYNCWASINCPESVIDLKKYIDANSGGIKSCAPQDLEYEPHQSIDIIYDCHGKSLYHFVRCTVKCYAKKEYSHTNIADSTLTISLISKLEKNKPKDLDNHYKKHLNRIK